MYTRLLEKLNTAIFHSLEVLRNITSVSIGRLFTLEDYVRREGTFVLYKIYINVRIV